MSEQPTMISDYAATEEERSFIAGGEGVSFLARRSRSPEETFLAAGTMHLVKWLRKNAPDTRVAVDSAPTLALHSRDFWLPFALLASDITLQVYLGLIVNYLYDRLKGSLQHDRHTVHLSVVHEDKATGKLKRFDYTGSVNGLNACVKKTDLSGMLED